MKKNFLMVASLLIAAMLLVVSCAQEVKAPVDNNLEISVKGGVGVEIEPYRGVAYMAPSFLAQVDASVFLSDHFSIAISPSVIFNNGDFLGGSNYQSSNIRILSIGASWNY